MISRTGLTFVSVLLLAWIGGGNADDKPLGVKVDDRCIQSEDKGPCNAAITRWHYDCQSKSCLKFDYGGCGGNENNHESQDECEATCFEAYCPPNLNSNAQMGRSLQGKKLKKHGKKRKRYSEEESSSEQVDEESDEEENNGRKKQRPRQQKAKEGESKMAGRSMGLGPGQNKKGRKKG